MTFHWAPADVVMIDYSGASSGPRSPFGRPSGALFGTTGPTAKIAPIEASQIKSRGQ